MLLLQIVAGTIMAHSYYDRTSFYGIEIDTIPALQLPARRPHPGADRLDRPVLDRRRRCFSRRRSPAGGRPGQGLLVDVLFWVTLVIVAGALIGNYLGIMGYIDEGWFWFGNQGLSYIQLGRFWQIGFFAGLVIWSVLVFRALWPTGAALWQATRQFWTGRIRLEHLIWAVHHQHRGALRLRHDPADRDREVLHDHRFLALVGGPSLGRAVVRVLRRQR